MATFSCGPATPRRLGQVIELREECLAEYTRVHADGHPGVRDLLAKWGLRNFSIFMQAVAGRRLLFLYAEYTGDDYERDMRGLAAEPRDAEWHRLCDPMQASLSPAGGWLPMDCVSAAPPARWRAGLLCGQLSMRARFLTWRFTLAYAAFPPAGIF